MTKRESQQLGHGLYILHWKVGGTSVASVGSDRHGRRWYAPTNWIVVPGFQWNDVQRVEKILDAPAPKSSE